MLTDADLAHLESLARLELTGADAEAFKRDLSALLGYFARLSELDTDGVEPLVRPIPSSNVFRADVLQPGLTQEAALELAVESEGGFFKVPRTVEADQ